MAAGFTIGGMATSVDGEGARRQRCADLRPVCGRGLRNQHRAGRKGYASGTQLGEGSYFRRRAGRHKAATARVDVGA